LVAIYPYVFVIYSKAVQEQTRLLVMFES